MALCLNCRAPLTAGQRFYCDDRCRREDKLRTQGKLPVPVRKKRCQGCNRELAGKQRKWCGESCRARARRERKKAELMQKDPSYIQQLENNFAQNKLYSQPGLTGNFGDFPGRIKRGSLTVSIRCTQVTPALGVYLPELHLKQADLKQKYKQALERIMNAEVFGYAVEVEII